VWGGGDPLQHVSTFRCLNLGIRPCVTTSSCLIALSQKWGKHSTLNEKDSKVITWPLIKVSYHLAFNVTQKYGGLWEDNIRMDIRKTGWESGDWIHLVQDKVQWRAVMYTVMNLRVP
jgi:hypothetical protein